MTWNPDEAAVQIARDLRAIVEMYGNLEDEAISRGDDRDVPGGEALLMLGPVANVEAWQHRFETVETTGGDTDYVVDQTGELAPLLVLATWEDAVRDELDQPTDLRASVQRAADYLRAKITWMVGDDENGDANFLAVDALMRDLKRCRSNLEAVLRDGIRHDRGVPCMYCGDRLIKIWGSHPAFDKWECKPCARLIPHGEYLLSVRDDFINNAPELTADDAVIRLDREGFKDYKATRIRNWGSRFPELRTKQNERGVWLYSIAKLIERIEKLESEVSFSA